MDNPSTSEDNSYKKRCSVTYCFVPMCPSNSIKFPDKLFLTVPQEPKLRKNWMKAVRRQHLPSQKSVLRCCADHFDMENDVKNWMKYKYVGGNLILKNGVVPHIFDCQQRMQSSKPRSVVLKRQRQEILKSIEEEQARELESPSCQVTKAEDISKNVEKSRDKFIQVTMYPPKRSKAVQVPNNVEVSPKKEVMNNQGTSPLKKSTYHLTYSDMTAEEVIRRLKMKQVLHSSQF